MKKNLQRTAICFSFFIFWLAGNVNAQMVYLPDTNFKNALISKGYGAAIYGDSLDGGNSSVINAVSLDLSSSGIKDLTGIASFINLNTLNCNFNSITVLPVLPVGLLGLYCYQNKLTAITSLPPNLFDLQCSQNKLTALPPLPSSLVSISCNDNLLTALPSLTSSYYNFIACNNNLITSLPILPDSLLELGFQNNQITTIPDLPKYLLKLYCSNNLLTSIPQLPATLQQLRCEGNTNLSCLPKLHDMNQLVFGSTNISCVPNYVNILNCVPPLNTLPLCDLLNVNGCQFFWNIYGQSFLDINSNCISDPIEPKVINMKLMLYDSTGNLIQQTYTGSEGLYSFDIDTGTYTYTVDTVNLPVLVSCPASGFQTSILTSVDSMDYDMDFGMQCKSGFDIGINAIVRDSGIFRPANYARINIKAGDMTNKYGLHCASGISGNVTVIISGAASYISAAIGSLIPNVNGDTLTYSIIDFGTINFNTDFKIIVQIDTTAIIGNTVCFNVSVTPTAGDIYPLNNSFQQCFNAINSYDPNEKEVYPINRIVDKNGELTYTIQFQNTGNSPAQHIYILDTLDAAINESSFELLAYSHQPQVQIIGNVVRFNFPNINLADSVSNEPASHGYVQYHVKLKESLILGTVISNTSYIYFDFNAPVQTNTVVDTLADCNNIAAINIINQTLCAGDTLMMDAALAYPSTIDWYIDSVYFSSNQSVSIQNLTIGNHEIKMVASNAYCNTEAISNIGVHGLPLVELGNDTVTCGLPVVLNSGVNNASYLWSNGKSTKKITVHNSGNYSVLVTDTNGCVNSDSVNVAINPLLIVQLGNDTSTCNSSVTLDAGAGNISYSWSNSETTQTIIASSTNNYSVTITDANGCTNSDSISIIINSTPVITFNAFSNSDTLCISSGLQTINSGNPPGGSFSGNGVTGNQFDPTITGTGMQYITYQYTDSNGCSNFATDSVWVDLCLGINLISKDESMIVYPNPVTSNSLHIGYLLPQNKSGLFQIYDVTGKIVFKYNLPQWSNEQVFNLSTLSNGVYNCVIISNDYTTSKKLVVINE